MCSAEELYFNPFTLKHLFSTVLYLNPNITYGFELKGPYHKIYNVAKLGIIGNYSTYWAIEYVSFGQVDRTVSLKEFFGWLFEAVLFQPSVVEWWFLLSGVAFSAGFLLLVVGCQMSSADS